MLNKTTTNILFFARGYLSVFWF